MNRVTVELHGTVRVPTPLGEFLFQQGDGHAGVQDDAIIDAIRSVVRPGMIVADIGANVGYFTRLLSDLVGPDGQVHALEPVPELFLLLLANCPQDNVIPYRIGASNVNETVTLVRDAVSSACGSVLPGQAGNPSEPCIVHIRRLGDLLPQLDFALIDTEGLDPKVVDGFIDEDRQAASLPNAMIVEHWDDTLDREPDEHGRRAAYDGARVRAWYGELGYAITDIDGGNLLLRRGR